MLSIGMKIMHASHLSDQELTTTVRRLAQDEREATVALIVHLAEFDARRLYEPAGFSSLFKYCRAVLRLSEDAVYNRIQSARAARRFPVIVDMLLARTLSPTTARLLARRLTPENHQELLSAASGLGKEDVEKLLAARFPRAGDQGVRAKSADGGHGDRSPGGCLSGDRSRSGGRRFCGDAVFGAAQGRLPHR